MFRKKKWKKSINNLGGSKNSFGSRNSILILKMLYIFFFSFFFVEKFLAMTLLNTHTWLCSREIGVHNFSENTWWDCSSFFFTGCVWHLDFLSHDWGETRRQKALILQNGQLHASMKKRWHQSHMKHHWHCLFFKLFPAQKGTHKIHW